MTGYVRQSAADIVPTAVVRAAPINNEYNALRDAFEQTAGHKHDGTAAEGHYVPLIADSDARNKVAVDTTNNRIGVFVEVSAAAVEQVRVQDGAIVPVTDNDMDLGTSSLEFKDLYIDGTANIDSLIADTADINAGTIDNTVVGATTAAAATFTTLTSTGSTTLNGTTVPASKTLVVTTDKLSVLAATSSSELAGVISDETGSGALVFANSPTLVTPVLGTPSSATLTNATGLPLTSGVTGTLPVANGGTGITSFGTGVATFLGTPSSANLAAAVTDETGTGALVFANSPTLVTPTLGTPASATLTNATGLPIASGVSGLGTGIATFLGTPSSANLASAVTDETGTGALVFANSPTLVTPTLGTPASATLTNATGLPLSTGVTGTLPIANGGTSATTAAGARTALLPSFTGNGGKVVVVNSGATDIEYITVSGTGTVTSVGGTGTVNGITLTGTVTAAGNLTLGGALSGVNLTTQVTGTLPIANGGTNATSAADARTNLSVPGLADANTFTSSNVISLSSTSDALRITQTGSGNALLVEDDTNPDSTPFVVTAAGKVGIGTSSPAVNLEVSSATGSATPTPTEVRISTTTSAADFSTTLPWGRLSFYSADVTEGGAKIQGAVDLVSAATSGGRGSMVFKLSAAGSGTLTERMRVTSTGLVGIGSSSPTYQLQVGGTGQETANLSDAGPYGASLYLQSAAVSAGSGGAVLFGTLFGNATPFAAIKSLIVSGYDNTTGDLAFSMRVSDTDTNLTEKMRLTSAGKLGIGTAAPEAKFDLAGDYKEGVVTANTGTSYTIDISSGTLQILTLTGSCTFTFPTATAGKSFTLILEQDATGSRTATWPAAVKWPSSTVPALTSTALKADKFIFTADGTNWIGSNAGQNYTV